MGRTKKADTGNDQEQQTKAAQTASEVNVNPLPENQETTEKEAKENIQESKVPDFVDNLLRLYPQYEEMWVTPSGSVHPKAVPEIYRKEATLYKNKYHK